MRRRTYLTTASGAFLYTIAGCSDRSDSDASAANSTNNTNTTVISPDDSSESPLRVIEQTIPETTTVGEEVILELVIGNTGEEPYRYKSRLIGVPDGPRAMEHEIDVTVAPGETTEWTSDPIQFTHAGVIEYRLPNASGFESATLLVEPVSKVPRIQAVNPVSEWNSFGDTFENAIEEATLGETIGIADRHRYWHDDGTYYLFRQVEITDQHSERVAIEQRTEQRTTDALGFETWEGMVWFDTRTWTPGSYTATVELRNEQTGERSDSVETTFELLA
jgi:hypothetical protein